jgi:RimJ/RimL family protein N-acetyltransferase
MKLEEWDKNWPKIISDDISLEIDAILPDSDKSIKLKPLTANSLKNIEYLSLITEWRRNYKEFFFSNFEPTIERTEKWLKSVFLSSPRNLFFLLFFEEKFIGHYAFKNLSEQSVFLDNLVKGVQGGHAKIIETTALALIDWLFDNFCISHVNGTILADNPYSIMSNKKIGFDFSEKISCTETNKEYYNINITRLEWEKNARSI